MPGRRKGRGRPEITKRAFDRDKKTKKKKKKELWELYEIAFQNNFKSKTDRLDARGVVALVVTCSMCRQGDTSNAPAPMRLVLYTL